MVKWRDDDAGRASTVTNARQKTTAFEFDQTNLLTKVTEPGGFDTQYAYDDGARLATRTNDRGGVETYEYDPLGRPTKLIDAALQDWRTFYDEDGRVDHTIDGANQVTDFTYDRAGRLLTTTPATGSPITYAYDKSSRLVSTTDGTGTTAFDYDPVGRPTLVDRAGRATTYGYDPAGRTTSVTYPGGAGAVTYDYDPAGRPETITDWAGRLTTYTYDDAGRVGSVERPGGVISTFAYDELHRPTNITTTRQSSTLLTQGYTYDANGNIETLTDDTGTATFTYDDLDRLTAAAYPGGQNYGYSYDAVGNMTSATSPAGSKSYTYDLADRVTSAGPVGTGTGSTTQAPTANSGGWTNAANAYSSNNVYATAAPAKNTTISMRARTFDFSAIPSNATITSVTVSVEWKLSAVAANSTLGSQAYVNGTARGSEFTNTSSPTTDTTQTYAVSGLTRADLLNNFEVQVRTSRANNNTAFTASLDAVSVTVGYTTVTPGTAPTYDDNGNMLTDGTYGGRTFTYDALGRLTGVTGNGITATYGLDGFGNRWSETLNSTPTNFDLDLSVPDPTVLADGVRTYLPGDPSAGYASGGVWQTALTDHLGSPIKYVSQTGGITTPVHYDPFGVPRAGSANPLGIGYAGEWKNGTGLINLRARSYDPVLGRFIGRDTFGGVASAPQTGNRYSYALNNPYRFTDPSGHFVQTVINNPGEIVSTVISFTAIPGLIQAGINAALGFDPLTGRQLEPWERTLGAVLVAAIPGAKIVGKLISAARGAIRGSSAFQRAATALGRGVRTLDHANDVATDIRFAKAGIASRWNRATTPWGRRAYQRSDIDWSLIRPTNHRMPGMTNQQAAERGFAPLIMNERTGRLEDVVLHHLNQDPRGAVVEIGRSLHGRASHGMELPWRKWRPDWAAAWRREQSGYWRWRSGAYTPPESGVLRLPGDGGG